MELFYNKEQLLYFAEQLTSPDSVIRLKSDSDININFSFNFEKETLFDDFCSSTEVEILLNGKRLLLDLENLKDYELAKKDVDGDFESNGHHYFTYENALRAAEKVGKRLFTKEEFIELCDCENYWDDKNSGRIFKIPTPSGGFTEVFFPASGARAAGSGSIVSPSTAGNYRSASPYGSEGVYASGLYFSSGDVDVHDYSYRADGFSVRCVREI